jgi:hypothetical protein
VDGAFVASRETATADGDVASTAAATLSFLLAGETDRAGGHQAQVRRGLEFLRSRVGPDGAVAGGVSVRAEALALWALSRATAATRDGRYRDSAARLASRFASLPFDASMAQVGTATWAVFALSEARNAGVPVDAAALERGLRLLDAAPGDNAMALAARALAGSVAGRRLADDAWTRLVERIDGATGADLDAWLFAVAAADPARVGELGPAVLRAVDRGEREAGAVGAPALRALAETMTGARGN